MFGQRSPKLARITDPLFRIAPHAAQQSGASCALHRSKFGKPNVKSCALHIQIMQLTCLIDATNKKNAPANRGIFASGQADQNFLS
jgi:hypothetical protein